MNLWILRRTARAALLATAVALLGGLAACSGIQPDAPEPEKPHEGIFGEGGILSFGDDKKGGGENEGGALGVNSYLWRAALDTLTFMPVASADPFGGVIITDWHSPSGTQNERFKLNIYILGRTLRADGVRVAAFKQVLRGANWLDTPMTAGANTRIEDAILSRARQLRNQKLVNE